MSRNRTASREAAAVANLATGTLPTLDDGGTALLAHLAALVAKRAPQASHADREDLTQQAALVALVEIAAGRDALEAARIAAALVARDHRQDAHENETTPADLTDATTVDALDALTLSVWDRPDAWTETTWTTRGNDALTLISAQEPPLVEALRGYALSSAAKMPKALKAAAEPYGEAVTRRHLAERGQPSGSDLNHRTSPVLNAEQGKHLRDLATWRNRGKAKTPAPGHRAQVPTSGPASAVVLTDAQGQRFLSWSESAGMPGQPRVQRRHPITAEQAQAMLTRTPSSAYRMSADDAAADHLAYLATPVGAVQKASGSKRKRDGGIGSPTIMRGPRLDWSSRTRRV